MTTFSETLTKHGADLESFHRFDDEDEGPDLLPYATLVTAREGKDQELDALLGVYEWQDNPLIFLVDGEELRNEEHLRVIRRRLAMRGDAPYVGVVRPGRLTVYQVSLDARAPNEVLVPKAAAPHTFAYLANERPGVEGIRRRWISEVVLRLLSQSIAELIDIAAISGDEAISLVGRALFTRFLGDRNLLPPEIIPDGPSAIARLFDSAAQATAISHWLDQTFNGEFLPLRPGLFDQLPDAAFHTLGNLLHRAEGGQLYLEWEEDWAHLDFAHIPVGVLSQAYELYLRTHRAGQQRKEGGYYTPHAIAHLMVSASFKALRREGNAHEARVLDPAAGAGVFLLTAFRQLVAERWRHDGERPNTQTMREILYRQIAGFDINESALRFAALGLYLLSIELDAHPEPVEKLRFQDLRSCSVLQKVGDQGDLGSLGDAVGEEHAGLYDLVIGNPPWSSSTKLADWDQVAERIKRLARARIPDLGEIGLLPNEPLDLPFVWRATEWAKPGGQIAFALHARLLFQQHDGMADARRAIFSALDVTGVVNGAEVRQTNVWPEISAPFCLLFARNQVPPMGASFRFISPHLEDCLNRAGHLRIDAANAELVTPGQIDETPEVLKILFRGGPLDLEVFTRRFARDLPSLRDFWQAEFGGTGLKLNYAGNGYQALRESSPIGSDGEPGVPADHLRCLPELTPSAMRAIGVDRDQLAKFEHSRLHRSRNPAVFRGPLLLVHKSPPVGSARIRVSVSEEDLVYSETYYGYSAHTHPNGRQLLRYLALLISSRPAFWYYLMASGEFGFEREKIEKATIDGVPVPPFEELGADELSEVDALFNSLAIRDNEQAWARVDAWAANLYGLRSADIQVLNDTLRFNLPFAVNRQAAQARPSTLQVNGFCETLRAKLSPWGNRTGREFGVFESLTGDSAPWMLVQVQPLRKDTSAHEGATGWTAVLNVADQLAATEVIYRDTSADCLWIAKLSQARYWSQSQALLLARRIVWEHADFLMGTEEHER